VTAATDSGQELREEFRRSVCQVLDQAAAARGRPPVWAPEPDDEVAAGQAALLGWTGLLIPERWGGAGAGMLEAIVVAEELGAHLTPLPFLSGAVLAATGLAAGGSEEQQQRWLPGLASGRLRAAVALTGPAGRPSLVEVRQEGGMLRGCSGFVLDGAGADVLLVAAAGPGQARTDLFAVDCGSPGVMITELLNVDRTRPLASVTLTDVPATAAARLPHGAQAIEAILDRGTVALAADAVGAARRALDLAVGYARQRQQFGRPIGSFQAVKHKLADMYLLVRGAALAVQGAAAALDAATPEASRLVAVAGSYAAEAAARVTGDAIQVHGGIGYTWEHDAQRLFKRAKFDELFLGDPAAHRERLARLVLGQA
jgi:alkylation response protein AidB-like acyl-CoA dehydrogenase